jgi:hypothetical protein
MEGNQEELSGKNSLKNEAKEFVGDLASTGSMAGKIGQVKSIGMAKKESFLLNNVSK